MRTPLNVKKHIKDSKVEFVTHVQMQINELHVSQSKYESRRKDSKKTHTHRHSKQPANTQMKVKQKPNKPMKRKRHFFLSRFFHLIALNAIHTV